MAVTPKDILAILAPFKTAAGVEPLKGGYIQDIVVEPHADGLHVNIHVDEVWRSTTVLPEDRTALAAFVLARFKEIHDVRVIPRAKDQANAAKKLSRPGQALPRTPAAVKMIAVISGKGGVGKSTVSINLAHALARLGFRTAILDCDIYGFSVPDLLQLADPVKTQERKLIPSRVQDIDVMSMKFFRGSQCSYHVARSYAGQGHSPNDGRYPVECARIHDIRSPTRHRRHRYGCT